MGSQSWDFGRAPTDPIGGIPGARGRYPWREAAACLGDEFELQLHVDHPHLRQQ